MVGGGGGWLSEHGRMFEKNIPNNSGMINPFSIVYHIIREEILLIAFFYSRSFRARKNIKQLVKYPRLYFRPAKIVYLCV